MRKSLLSIMIVLAVGLFGGTCRAKIIDKIVAIVNGEIITLSELDLYPPKPRGGFPATPNPLEQEGEILESQRGILDYLIEEKLIDQQCRKRGIKVPPRDIDTAIEDVKRAHAVTHEQLKMALAADGVSWEEYRQQIGEQIKKMKLVSHVVRRDFTLDDDALRRYYAQNIQRFKEPDQIRTSHILIMIPQNADDLLVAALRHKGETILERLRRGEDFQELARLYSDDASAKTGGDLGFFKRGEILPELEGIAFNLKPGEISRLVWTKIGFHIVKITERREGRVIPFEDVTEKVKGQYVEEQSERLFKDWLKKLKAQSFIEVKL
jgi:peptidyl-prolyl cis-trans isomerase SurA